MVDNIVKINPNEYTVLDVGCGMRKYKGKEGQRVIGIDKVKTPCVDIVYDIDKGLPFKDKSLTLSAIPLIKTLEVAIVEPFIGSNTVIFGPNMKL